MVSPEDLRYTSLLAFSFALITAAVFQFAGLPSLSSWAMILGGVATVIFRASAVRLAEKQRTRAGSYRTISTDTSSTGPLIPLTDNERRELIEKAKQELKEEIEDADEENPNTDESVSTTNEHTGTEAGTEEEDRDVDTETN